jgi:beta-lactamase class A
MAEEMKMVGECAACKSAVGLSKDLRKTLPSLVMRLALLLTLSAASALAQEPLRQKIRAIAGEAHGKVSVACSLPGSALNCDLNPNAQPPMQSVFKLPLALTVLHQVEEGTLSLDQPVRFLPRDRILPHVYSPLQDQYPDAGVDVPLHELLRLGVSRSDNVAADILLRLVGGPKAVNTYIAALRISGFHLQDSEAVLHQEVLAQYRNWFEPAGAVQLLHRISNDSPLKSEHTDMLLGWMTSDFRTKRLEGDLPAGTRVAHKSGTSDVDDGVAHATNDIGLISLPDGRRIAIAVFVTDSTADEATREQVIARIARAAYDASLQSTSPAANKLH